MLHTPTRHFRLAAITISAMLTLPAAGQTINEDAKLLPADGADFDQFGYSVAINGTTAVVGTRLDDDIITDSGSAYLFDTTTRQQITKLLPADGARSAEFGYSVAINETTALIGALSDPEYGHNSGAAYLFDTATGQQIAKLVPPDGRGGYRLGCSVAISGTIALVGAYGDADNGPNSGAAYLFDTTNGQLITKLLPTDGTEDDRFGGSVAISDTTALVGAELDDDNGYNSGAAYLFDITTGQQITKLLPADGAEDDRFGCSVAISGTIALVGAFADDDYGVYSGSAYLFDTTTGQQIAKILPNDGNASDFFGSSVAISGNIALVGAHGNDDNGSFSGSAYLFDITTGHQITKILPSDGVESDTFGNSVAISGTTAVVGALHNFDDGSGSRSGAAYLFNTIAAECIADLNDDGELNFFDVSEFLIAYQALDPVADFNGDGNFTFFDVSAFLIAYQNGCP